MSKLACGADVCYNQRRILLGSESVPALSEFANLLRRLAMDMIPQDSTSYKRCANPDCENPWLPATTEYFSRNNHLKSKLASRCKECCKQKSKEYYHKPENHERIKQHRHQPEYRAKNREEKRAIYADPEKKAKLLEQRRLRYRRPEVRARILAHTRLPEVKARHRDHSRRRSQRSEYKVWKREYDRQYRQRPGVRERKRLYSRGYYWRPGIHERLRDYQNNYCKSFSQKPEQRIRARVKAHIRNAQKKAIRGTHTTAQIQEQLKRQHYRCYYAACGFSKFPKVKGRYVFEIEHTFPISRVVGTDIPANDMSYLVLACEKCNGSKGTKFPWEWPEGGRLL